MRRIGVMKEGSWPQSTSGHGRLPAKRETEGVCGRLPTITCPFCDHLIKASRTAAFRSEPSAAIIKCASCGEAFEANPDQEEESYMSEGFF